MLFSNTIQWRTTMFKFVQKNNYMSSSDSLGQQNIPDLKYCLALIEEKMGWGNAENWANKDFEQLSEQLAMATGVTLSITTLKRVWGRVKYDSAPTTTTLNTLAVFIGYENWRSFEHMQQDSHAFDSLLSSLPSNKSIPGLVPIHLLFKGYKRKAVATMTACLLIISIVAFIKTIPKPILASDYTLSSRLVVKGLPNSVIFHYKASVSPTDSVFIQQSWDPERRQPVPKNGTQHTAIYYYPGYYQAKLIIGKQVVQEHDLIIPSEGWNVAVRQEPVPVYFSSSEALHNGSLYLPLTAIQKQNISLQPIPPKIQYRYVNDFKNLMTDNFVFETRLKNEYNQGSAACQKTNIVILCRNEFLSIPLVVKGCVGNLRLHLAGHEANSKTSDLSGFGTDMSDWVDVRCEVRNKHLSLWINGSRIYETVLNKKPVGIVGISYVFEGTGAVNYTRFTRTNGEVVFEDNFDNVLPAKSVL